MDERLVREIVREAVARRLDALTSSPARAAAAHPSHALFVQLVNETDACVIEPAVQCNHCGYCKSHGH